MDEGPHTSSGVTPRAGKDAGENGGVLLLVEDNTGNGYQLLGAKGQGVRNATVRAKPLYASKW